MNAGELIISLILEAGGFREDLADAQDDLDRAGEAGRDAMDDIAEGANEASDEIENLNDNLGDTGDALKGAAKRGEDAFSKLMGVLTKVAGLVGVGLSVKSLVSQYLDEADALGKYSDALNLNIEDVQAWEEAVKHAGGDGESFKATLQGLTANLTQAAEMGKGRLLPFFKELGISVKDASGKAKSAIDILPELAEKFETMSASDAAGFGQKLGIDKGTIMLLQQGRKATEEAIKAGKEHIKFTKADADAAAAANDAIQDMQTAFISLSMRAISPFIPLITKVANILHDFAQWCSNNKEAVTAFFLALATVATAKAIPALIKFGQAHKAAMLPMMKMEAIIAVVAGAFDELWAFATGGESVLERLMRRFGMTQESIEAVREVVRAVIGVFLDLWDAVTGDEETADAAIGRLKEAWESAKEFLANIIESVKQAFLNMVNSILRWFSNMFSNIKAWLLDLLPDWLKKIIGGGGGEEEAKAHEAAANGDKEARKDFDMLQQGMGTPSTGLFAKNAEPKIVDNSKDIKQNITINQNITAAQGTDAQAVANQSVDGIRNITAQANSSF